MWVVRKGRRWRANVLSSAATPFKVAAPQLEVTMMIDRYTKWVLTIIALALAMLAWQVVELRSAAATTHTFVPKHWGRAFAVSGGRVWFEDANGALVEVHASGTPVYH